MGLDDVHLSANHDDVDSSTFKHTLQLKDNTYSRITQLDIEHSDHTMMSGNTENVDDEGDMEEDLPPLTTYLSGWKFWCQFAIWPFVFLVLNGIIVSTLVVFSEYEFKHGKRSSRRYDPYAFDNLYDDDGINFGSRSRGGGNVQYEMMKYNRMIIAILLAVDAVIVYRAVTVLDRKIRELDMIGDVDHEEDVPYPSSPTTTGIVPNVHAQVSRKLDVVLGRAPQPRVSILVSLLWLLFVACTTVSLVSVVDLVFAVSPKGKKVCKWQKSESSSLNNNTSGDDAVYPNDQTKKKISGIPDELQEWAQQRHDYFSLPSSSFAHLTNGVTFFSVSDQSEDKNEMDLMYFGFASQLMSVDTGGNMEFYKNVYNPMYLTSVSGDNLLNTTKFCCVYKQKSVRQDRSYMDYSALDTLILCADDRKTDGIFPNVTVFESLNTIDGSSEVVSIKSYKNVLWVQAISYIYTNVYSKTSMIFFNVSFEDVMKLNKVTEVPLSSDGYGFESNDPFLVGPDSKCYKWTRTIDTVVFLIVLGSASLWLTSVKNLSVGVVPAIVAVSLTFSRINHGLGFAITSLAAVAAFIGLLGCIRIPLKREKLIWAMYTLLFCVAGMIYSGRFYDFYDGLFNFEHALATIIIASLIGFILNHPVLYLFGWIGGIWAIFGGIFLLFTPPHREGIFAICLGIIMGVGCATVGFNLIKYRVHVVYYSKRAWIAMNAAMQSNNRGRSNHRMPDSTPTRYAPVIHTPPIPPTSTQTPGRSGNDITAGLLNQDTEG